MAHRMTIPLPSQRLYRFPDDADELWAIINKCPNSVRRLRAANHLTQRLFGSMLRRILALPLPAGLARQPSETSLDDSVELTGRCP